MSEEAIRSLIEDLYRSRLANDAGKCAAHFAPTAVLRVAGSQHASAIAAAGNEANSVQRHLEEFVAAWQWRKQRIMSFTIQGDRAAVHYELEATFIPTGELVRTELVDLIEVRDGKIAGFVEFLDTAHISQLAAKASGGARAQGKQPKP